MDIKYINIAIEQCKQEKNGYEEKAEMMEKRDCGGRRLEIYYLSLSY